MVDRRVLGTIRKRLLVNALVDPDEAARSLPKGLRPHVAGGATVVGCCLLEIDQVRPAGAPAFTGRHLMAAAHRISAEWDTDDGMTLDGVYVPLRHTTSRLAIALGGRWFPGVHAAAQVKVTRVGTSLRWQCEPEHWAGPHQIRVKVSVPPSDADSPPEVVGQTCLHADLARSPRRDCSLETARMAPAHRMARSVEVEQIDSTFLDGFATAQVAPSYLMENVAVAWSAG